MRTSATIFVEGTGTFNRNDIYGVFTASYDWKTYFDPTTGYIVGYVYVESDTDPAGDGFVITDSLAVTSTTYALTQASASTGSSSSGGISTPLLIGLVVLVIVIVLVVVVLLVLTRRRSSLPRHSARGNIGFGPPPGGPPMGIPPPVHLTPSGPAGRPTDRRPGDGEGGLPLLWDPDRLHRHRLPGLRRPEDVSGSCVGDHARYER